MSTIAKLLVALGIDSSEYNEGLSKAEQRTSSFGNIVQSAAGLAVAGFAVVGGSAVAAGLAGLNFNNSMEIVTAQLNAFTKDGAKSAEILAMIKDRASKTPFAFEEMAKATASLLPAAKASGKGLEELISLAEILAASNPAEGLEGAAFSLKEALSGDFTSIIERFNLPRQRLKELKEEGVPALQAVQIAMQELGLDTDLVTNLSNTASGRWSTFKDTMVGVAATVTQPIFDLISSSLGRVNDYLAANQPLLDAFASVLSGKIVAAITAVTSGFSGFNGSLSISSAGLSQFAPIIDGTMARFQLMQAIVVSVFNSISTVIAANSDSIASKLNGAWETVVSTANNVFTNLNSIIMAVLGQVLTFVQGNGADIAKTVVGWTSQVIDIVTTAMQLLSGIIQGVYAVILEFTQNHGADIQTVLRGAWDVISNVISGALTIIGGILKAALQIFQGDWSGAWSTIQTMSVSVLGNIQGIITGALNIIAGFFGTSLSGIVTLWQNNFNMLVSIAIKLTANIIETLMRMGSDAIAAGSAVVDGIRSGISNGWETLKSFVANKAKELLNAAKSALGISSPSKLFADVIGKNIVLGISTGVTHTLPQLNTVIENMTISTVNQARDFIGDMSKAFAGENLKNTAKTTGENALKGMIAGLQSKVGEAISKAKDVAQRVVDAMANKLEIASPSAVFAREIGVPIITGIIKGMDQTFPQLLQYIGNAGRKILSETLGVVASFTRSSGIDVFRSLLDIEKLDPFQPLVDASDALKTAQDQALGVAGKLLDVNAEINTLANMPFSEMGDHVKHNEKLAKLYAEQAILLNEQANAQANLANLGQKQAEMQAKSAQQQMMINQIADNARQQYNAAQQQALAMMQTDAKGALAFFNARKAQIAELAELEKQRALATTDQQRSDLDTQIALVRAAQGVEQQQQAVDIYISSQDQRAMGDEDILKIIQNALMRAGITVDIRARTA